MKKKIPFYLGAALFLYLCYSSSLAVEFNLAKLLKGAPYMADFLGRMFPPNLEKTFLKKVASESLLTIQLAWISTVLATILALPLGFMAASNGFANRYVKHATLFLLHADRAIDSLILALFFVSAVGLGPFPGTLALTIHSVGMLGKLFADAIEACDPGPIEALESTGASKLATIRWAIWPQLIPHFISFFLFRFELNIRSAVVLGLVGAGGIGFLLTQYMRLFQYQEVCTVVLVILAIVMLMDSISARVRRAVL